MKGAKKITVLFLTLALILTSINLNPATVSAASWSQLNKKKVTVLVGSKTTLKVENIVKGAQYKWSSSDKKVAAVSSKGVVSAKKKGTVDIKCKVTDNKKSYTLSCKVTVLKGAQVIRIQNKSSVAKIKVGDQVDLNRKLYPASSNDKTTWTSSDETIAKPDKKGKFTALKAGKVTITATTKSGCKDEVAIQVFGGEKTVASQAELDSALKENVTKITIATEEETNLKIAKGDYSLVDLVVNAPKADITNQGKFASITINQIKASTWYEDAMKNLLNVNADNARVVVNEGASASIKVTKENANLVLVNNGSITSVDVGVKSSVKIEGTSKKPVVVNCNAAGAKVTTNVPVELNCTQKITLTLEAGAEGTIIHAASQDLVPEIKGSISVNVIVGTGDDAKTVTVTPVPSGSGYVPSTPSSNNPTPTPEPVVEHASLRGKVTMAETGTAVSGSSIRLAQYDGSEESFQKAIVFASTSSMMSVSNTTGDYKFERLNAGHYVQLVAATGCAVNVSKIEVQEKEQKVHNVALKLLPEGDAGMCTVSGSVIEAITNQPVVVSGGSIRLTAVKKGDPSVSFVTSVVSGSSYKFEKLPEGTYDVSVQDLREGIDESKRFKDGQFTIFALGGAVIDGQNVYLVNNSSKGTATFVLTWGEYPKDLDSHLLGKDGAGKFHHIYFENETANITVPNPPQLYDVDENSYEYYSRQYDLRLDVDDTDSYGPETTSVYRCNPDDAWYTFFVYNYSGNSEEHTLFNSLAQVSVTTETQTKVFSISQIQNGTTQRVWVVCRINAITGEIQPVNEIYNNYRDVEDDHVEFNNDHTEDDDE